MGRIKTGIRQDSYRSQITTRLLIDVYIQAISKLIYDGNIVRGSRSVIWLEQEKARDLNISNITPIFWLEAPNRLIKKRKSLRRSAVIMKNSVSTGVALSAQHVGVDATIC